MQLNEELFETASKEQTQGVATLLSDQISKFWSVVNDVESIKTTVEFENYEEMSPVIDNISSEVHNIIGQLEQLLNLITPKSEDVELGKEEAVTVLDNQDNAEIDTMGMGESLLESTMNEIPLFQDVEQIVASLNDVPEVLNVASDEEFDNDFFYIEFADSISREQAQRVINFLGHEGVGVKDWDIFGELENVMYLDIREDTPLDESLKNQKNIDRQQSKAKLESIDEPLNESEGSSNTYYVSYYEESPKYNEDTETYDTTCKLISSEEFDNLEDAKKRIKELTQEQVDEGSLEEVTDEFYLDRSRYIGMDKFWIIEDEQGSEEILPTSNVEDIPEDSFEDIPEIEDEEIDDNSEE